MNKDSRWWKVGLAAWLVALTAAGCGGQAADEPVPAPSALPSAAPSASLAPSPTPEPFAFPLTGLGSPTAVRDRPIMVMIENSPAARPQTGLDEADIVYEILAEGEITRFAAFFQSKSPEVIGPVRSIRPYYVELGEGWDAVLVHAGWSPAAITRIKQRGLNHFDQVYGDDRYYWRDKSRKAPHNLYTSIAKIREGIAAKKYRQEWKTPPLPAFAKPGGSLAASASPEGPSTVRSAARTDIPYIGGYDVAYEYDAATGLYGRLMEGKPHKDARSDRQLTAANVLILETKHVVLDKEGRRDVDLDGPGKGMWLAEGQAREIKWARKDGILRASIDGREIALKPGTTWVQIVPAGTAYSVQ
ncbi:DUF3048 domain-containing protein [Paenibacillus thermoaerophilus]|uniref:DUF3048 domain-containing protein n=1 Tax=Paenibacillus thermoaerophilus TaxID=1215385 RepID=A0ABW2V1V4_9BACL|nr:DUF3048 domain-containing protein [Paenibacillus thermoaerophilus]